MDELSVGALAAPKRRFALKSSILHQKYLLRCLMSIVVLIGIIATRAETKMPYGSVSFLVEETKGTMPDLGNYIEDRLKTLNRRPPTPKSQRLGLCIMFLGIITAAIGTYHILTGRLGLLLLFWSLTFVLIYLGLNEWFFGDGPISSFLP